MELRHLRYFVTVAELLNFTKAAIRLRVAQPALSRQIRDLEDELGVQLLERGPRAVRLTGAGATFLDEAKAVLQRSDEAVKAVRAVANGEAIFGPGIADRLQHFLSRPPSDPNLAFPQLTSRETEILHLLAKHRTNSEIAAELFLSQKTVRNYVSAIFAKLHVADRAEAGRLARDAGLGERSVDQPLR